MDRFGEFARRLGREIEFLRISCFQAEPSQNTRLHAHWDQLHINCIESGRGVCVVDGQTWQLEPGCVHIVLPGEPHQYLVDPRRPYRSCFIHFRWTGPVPGRLARMLTVPARERRDFFRLLHQLAELNNDRRDGIELLRGGLLMQILGQLVIFSGTPGAAPFERGLPPGELYPVLRKLCGPPFDYPGLDALAESVGMSRRKLTSLFRRTTGMSVKQYYLQNVMRYAESMLQSGEFRTSDIMHQCGYTSMQNFRQGLQKYMAGKTSR